VTTLMDPAPTMWRLDGRIGWRTGRRAGVEIGARSGIRLAVDPSGPLRPTTPDGSLGGLRLPREMALDALGTLHLVSGGDVLRFDPEAAAFGRLPLVRPAGADPPTAIAFAGDGLYLAGGSGLLIYDARTLELVEEHAADHWELVGLDALGDRVWIADRGGGCIHRHRWGSDGLRLLVASPQDAGAWSALAVDREGRAHVLHEPSGRLVAFSAKGRPEPVPADPGDVRDRFDPPPIRLDHRGRFCLPVGLAKRCGRRLPGEGPPPHAPLALCTPGSGGRVFDLHGRRAGWDPAEPAGPPLYAPAGTWVSEPLDSGIASCQWDRVELELKVPPGTRVAASTYAAEQLEPDVDRIADDLWSHRTQLTPAEANLLVQSRNGRYLRLRLELEGDGYATPAVRSALVRFPRESYLRYLPAIYSADDESRWFLERFLAAFQVEWDALEDELGRIERFFDPAAVPAGPALEFLAGWLDLPLEASWEADQQRPLLMAAPKLLGRRGTPAAVREHLRAYLESMTRTRLPDGDGFPQIRERYAERDLSVLGPEHGSTYTTLGHGPRMWSPGVVGRLRLGVYAREGEARLVSTGEPERDAFAEHAHRFRVYIPATWVRTAEDELMVRRAVDAEKPAHTAYDLCLVEPRFRVGVQSTVGLDTIIAAMPRARLRRRGGEAAPSLPPSGRLGFDTVLRCRNGRCGPHASPRREAEEAPA
jgi:phage tail-like protein